MNEDRIKQAMSAMDPLCFSDQQLIDEQHRTCHEVLAMLSKRRTSSLMPTLEVHARSLDDPHSEPLFMAIAIAGDWNNQEAKPQVMYEAGLRLHESGIFPIRAAMVCEAWVGRGKTNAGAHFAKELHQEEAIVVHTLTLNAKAVVSELPVTRGEVDEMIPSGEWETRSSMEGHTLGLPVLANLFGGWLDCATGQIKKTKVNVDVFDRDGKSTSISSAIERAARDD